MSVTNTQNIVVLESASQALAEATAGPPFLYELSPAEARAVVDELQAAPIDKLPVADRWITVPADVGDVRVRIVRLPDAVGTLPVILSSLSGSSSAPPRPRLTSAARCSSSAPTTAPNSSCSPSMPGWPSPAPKRRPPGGGAGTAS